MKALSHTIITIAAASVLLTGVQIVHAQRKVGIGFIVGTPTAISAKFINDTGNSLDLLFAWREQEWFFIQGQYDYRISTLDQAKEYDIGVYAGPGAFVQTYYWRGSIFGFSGNVGVEWIFSRRFAFFTEVSPKIGLAPETKVGMTGGFGFRFHF